jgi:hypothetical protein
MRLAIYTLAHLTELLRAAGIKRVCMRYRGEEGRGGVEQVNFLSRRGAFLGYDEIQKHRIPENQIYEIGSEILERCKDDWLEDWGGRGELQWEPGKPIRVRHYDRRVIHEEMAVVLPEKQLASDIAAAAPPSSEMAFVIALEADFIMDEGRVVFERIQSQGDAPSASPALFEAAQKVFSAALGLALRDPALQPPVRLVSGHMLWSLKHSVHLVMQTEREVFEEMKFTVPVDADIRLNA